MVFKNKSGSLFSYLEGRFLLRNFNSIIIVSREISRLKVLLCNFDIYSAPINYTMPVISISDKHFKMFPTFKCFSVASCIKYSSNCVILLCTPQNLQTVLAEIPS